MPLMATFDPSAACGGSSPSEGALWACAHPTFPPHPTGQQPGNVTEQKTYVNIVRT